MLGDEGRRATLTRHCERSEAIQRREMDCRLASLLAMMAYFLLSSSSNSVPPLLVNIASIGAANSDSMPGSMIVQ